jgi:hypothetical protein
MSSRNMRLLPWAALRSDSEQRYFYVLKTIVLIFTSILPAKLQNNMRKYIATGAQVSALIMYFAWID